MPRRAVRRLKQTVDLGRHYYELTAMTPPLDPRALFADPKLGPTASLEIHTAPLEIEIGSGKGLFLQGAARRSPERLFLGNELATKYALHIGARLAAQQLNNAAIIHGDGLRLLREFIPSGCAAAVHVYFPDPWWKARHKKRRVLNEAMLADAVRVLQHGGKLHFWTDVQEYYETTIELIQRVTLLIGPTPVPEPAAEHDLDFRTHFERRTRLNRDPVFRCEFEKV